MSIDEEEIMPRLDTSSRKNILIAIVLVVILVCASFLIYSIAVKTIPEKRTDDASIGVSNDTSAKTAVKQALEAEVKNDYSKAKTLYSQSLTYFESKQNKSPSDQNEIENIKTRLIAIKDQQESAKSLTPVPSTVTIEKPQDD